MATRLDYRNRLKDKLLGLEDEGYGDFEYADSELNTYLEFAVSNLYPALYKRMTETLSVTAYGTNNYGYVTATAPENVFLVEDSVERTPIFGWEIHGNRIQKIDDDTTTVIVHYTDAFALPADDVTDAAIAARYTPLIVLGSLIEALESRHDTGVRPDPSSGHQETQLLDRLMNRYQTLRADMGMSLPAVAL